MSVSSTTEKKRVFASTGAVFIACAIAALLIAAVAAFAMPEKAYASFKSTSSTTNSITVAWDDPNANNSYETVGYLVRWVGTYETEASKIKEQTLGAAARSFTISNLAPGTKYSVVVQCYYKYNSTVFETPRIAGSDYYLSTRVVKPTGVKQTKWSYKNSAADFTWDVQTGADQIECKLVDGASGKKILGKTFYSLVTKFTAVLGRKDILYAVQMRVKDAYGWSAWSDKMYFLSQPLTNYKTKVANNKLTVGWNKVKGAQKYTIYVSTKAKTGYKKVGTAKSTKSSMVFKKFKGQKFSPKKTYYVYVQATKKVGGKTFTSGKHYAYKVKGASGKMAYPF